MNPGTSYSPASLLNPRAKRGQTKLPNGRPKPPPTPCPTIIPIAHALLNPKGSGIIKKKKYGSSDITATASNRDQFSKLTTPDRESGGAQTNQCGLASAAAIIQPAQFVFTTSNNSYNDGDDEDYNAHHNNSTGQASLLAKSYNVEDRSEQYVKRQKMSGTNVSTWAGSKSTSEVSRHLKEKRAEGVAREIPLNHSNTRETSPIDLTKDTEEEEEDLVESSNQIDNIQEEIESYEKKPEKIDSEDPEVCIGQIDGAMINVDKIPAFPKTSKYLGTNTWPAHRIYLKKLDQRTMRITAFDCRGTDFGTLGAQWAYAVCQALNGKKITKLWALLLNRKKSPGQAVGDAVSTRIPAHILVYCKKSMGLNLYRQLAKAKTPLRLPVGSDEWLEKIKYYDVESELFEEGGTDTLAGAKLDPAALQKLEHDVFDVLNDIPEHNDLMRMEANPMYISTSLLDYQKQGLRFMTEQEVENHPLLWENDEIKPNSGAGGRSLWRVRMDDKEGLKYLNRATGHVQVDSPFHTRGGLLADQMGLGKTLTIIALIASTIDAADDWSQIAEETYHDGIKLCSVRTTLVVAPLTVLQNWEEQLEAHTIGESLQVLKYHGTNRPTKLDHLADYDVILTTYGTIQREMSWRNARDNRRKSLFAHFNFYRVVLDEAHYIKGHTTDRAQAIFNIQAERRWAVTGTPIQNGLEDFGSILKFLRLAPFDKMFKQLVTLPAKREPEIVLGRMRLVFNSITLRRTKDKLSLPQNIKILQKVELRDDERALYKRFTEEIQRGIRNIATEELSRKYMTFFSQLLSCRRICDSIDLLSDKEKGVLQDATELGEEDSDSRSSTIASLTEDEGYKQLDALNDCMAAECSRCSRPLLEESHEGEVDKQEICRFWDCQCFVCPECSESFERAIEDSEEDGRYKCPETDIIARISSVKLTYPRLLQYREHLLRQEQGSGKVTRRYTRASSKTEALLQHLEGSRRIGYTDKLPNKAVVFTCWSTYLDLIQIDLEKAGFKFLRLDGSVSQPKRVRILEQFNNDPRVTVLISTIGVGGVGLNLQIANSIFIMEPQWNPAAEEQAVDRVHRLGQTRNVKTVRFMVEDTVEVGVRMLAQQKQALADLTTSGMKLKRSDVTAKVQELLSVLQRR